MDPLVILQNIMLDVKLSTKFVKQLVGITLLS